MNQTGIYNPKSEFYPNLFNPFYFIRKGLNTGIHAFADRLHGKLMDFGCGSKPYKPFFKVDEYIGVDYENEGHSHKNELIDVYYDGKSIPFPDNHFDSVLSSEVFEHVFNLNEVLTEINRVMKKDGNMLLSCPFVWNEHEIPNDFARYTRYAMNHILKANGFEIVELRKSGNFITTIFQLWNLYFYHQVYLKIGNISPLRWLYKLVIVLPINFGGICANFILPNNRSLYLNTIILARKAQ